MKTGRLVEPGSLRCDCGERHNLALSNDSECRGCGAQFNAVGQALLPRDQWVEFDFDYME